MMRVHLTRAATFGPFCQYLGAGGVNIPRRLSRIGVAPHLMESAEALVPLRQCCHFAEQTARQEGVSDIGLEVGSRSSIGDFGLFGKVLRQSLTLKDLINKLVKWMPLVDSGARAWLQPEPGTDSVRLCIDHDVDIGRSLANDYAVQLLIDAVRMVSGPDWRPVAIWLNRHGPDGVEKFEALSDAALHSHPEHAGFLIPRRLLSQSVKRETRGPHSQSDPEQALEVSAPPDDLIGSVACALRSSMQNRAPSLEEVAELAGASKRGMQRHLLAEGTSYRDLLDRVRHEEATALLGQADTHVSEIAYHLGYNDPANFTHAFVRWTGISPSEYRLQGTQAEN